MKSVEKKTLKNLKLNKVKIVALSNQEKHKVLGGGNTFTDIKTGVPCIAIY